MTSSTSESRQRLWGMFTRRERWALSWRGWLGLFIVIVGLMVGAFLGVYPFLAVTERVETPYLAVEGWVDVYAVEAAAAEFRAKPYQMIFSTGGPVHGMGGYTNDYNTSASVAAGRLKKAGLPPEVVQMVPSRVAARDRTYSSALALRAWCEANKVPLTRINVVTEDVHARRTRLLFQMALGDSVKVGIIAVPNPDYDARRWWRYSEGVRAVLAECIAYVYAKVFFVP